MSWLAVGASIVGGIMNNRSKDKAQDKTNASQAAADKRNAASVALADKNNNIAARNADGRNNRYIDEADRKNNAAADAADYKRNSSKFNTEEYNWNQQKEAQKRQDAAVANYNSQLFTADQADKRDLAAADAANQEATWKNRELDVQDRDNMFVDMRAAAIKGGFNPLAVLKITGGAGFGAGSAGAGYSGVSLPSASRTPMYAGSLGADRREAQTFTTHTFGTHSEGANQYSASMSNGSVYRGSDYSFIGTAAQGASDIISGANARAQEAEELRNELTRTQIAAANQEMTQRQTLYTRSQATTTSGSVRFPQPSVTGVKRPANVTGVNTLGIPVIPNMGNSDAEDYETRYGEGGGFLAGIANIGLDIGTTGRDYITSRTGKPPEAHLADYWRNFGVVKRTQVQSTGTKTTPLRLTIN